MQAIATRVIEATECDTVVSILEVEVAFRDSVIEWTNGLVTAKAKEAELYKSMLDDSKEMVKDLEVNLDNEIRDHKNTKVKWFASVLVTVFIMTFITR